MRVLMAGGGTAGHVNPALAIADIVKDRDESSVIEFIGTKKGIESDLVPKAGYKLRFIEVSGLKRSLSPKNIKTLINAYKAISECKKIIKEFKPDVVIGTGGYVCWPLIRAAAFLKIPCALHEANAEPGFAVKTLRTKADLIMVGFESAKKSLEGHRAKIVITGLPVKKGFRLKDKSFARERCGISASYKNVIVSFGGSLGAKTINDASLDFIGLYAQKNPGCLYIHSTGKRSYDEYMRTAKEKGYDKLDNVRIQPYIDSMSDLLNAADIAVCRSGASTLAELAASGCPSVLVPSPNVTNDQQTKNARMFEEKGASVMITDSDFTGENFAKAVKGLLTGSYRKDMSKACKELDFPSCEDLIFNAIKSIM